MSVPSIRGQARKSSAFRSTSGRTSPAPAAAPARSSTTPLICVPSTSWPDASTGAPRVPPSRVRQAPTASKFSSARPAGSIMRWQLAHAGLRRCCSMRSRTDFGLAAPASSSNGGTTSGGGGGGDAEHVLEDPLAAQHRRGAMRVRRHHQDRRPCRADRCASRPSASRGGSGCRRRSGCRSDCASRSLRNV